MSASYSRHMAKAFFSFFLGIILFTTRTAAGDAIDTDYYYQIQNISAGLQRSLDVSSGDQGPAEFKLTNDNQPTQIWRFQHTRDGRYHIFNRKYGNKVLTVFGGSQHGVALRPIGHEGHQQFVLRHLWGNRYVMVTGRGDLTLNVRPEEDYRLNGVPRASDPGNNSLMVFLLERRGPIWHHHHAHHGGWGPGPVRPPEHKPWPDPNWGPGPVVHEPKIAKLTHQMKRLANRLENETQHAMGSSAYFLSRMLGNLPVFTIIDNGSLPHRSDFQRTRQTMSAVINNPKKGQDWDKLQKVRQETYKLQKEVAEIRRLHQEHHR